MRILRQTACRFYAARPGRADITPTSEPDADVEIARRRDLALLVLVGLAVHQHAEPRARVRVEPRRDVELVADAGPRADVEVVERRAVGWVHRLVAIADGRRELDV